MCKTQVLYHADRSTISLDLNTGSIRGQSCVAQGTRQIMAHCRLRRGSVPEYWAAPSALAPAKAAVCRKTAGESSVLNAVEGVEDMRAWVPRVKTPSATAARQLSSCGTWGNVGRASRPLARCCVDAQAVIAGMYTAWYRWPLNLLVAESVRLVSMCRKLVCATRNLVHATEHAMLVLNTQGVQIGDPNLVV